jgi:hypothetical protein
VRHGGRPRRRPQDAPRDLNPAVTEEAALPAVEQPIEPQPEVEVEAVAEPVAEMATAQPPDAEPASPAEPAAEPAAAEPAAERDAEPAAAEPDVASEPSPAIEPAADASSADLTPAAYVPVGEPPLGLSSALAIEFGRAIEASWASAEVEEAELDAEPDALDPGAIEPDTTQADDPLELQVRLARVHLRTGALALARAEFEKLAGRGLLDPSAMVDLAEARWRTGDLTSAGVAANAYIAGGGGEALGFVIAAEAASAADRPAEARRHAGRALERSHLGIETYFAGMPRLMTWPQEATASPVLPSFPPAPSPARTTLGQALPAPAPLESSVGPRDASLERSESPATPARTDASPPAGSSFPGTTPPAQFAAAIAEAESPTPIESSPTPDGTAEAGVEVQLGVDALQSQDLLMAALHFGVALRLTPACANAVLEAIGERRGLPLDLVRGDALRLMGNQTAAAEAYLSVAAELRAPAPAAEEPLAEGGFELPDEGDEPIEAPAEPEAPVDAVDKIAGTDPPAAEPQPQLQPEPELSPIEPDFTAEPELPAQPESPAEPTPEATSQTEPASPEMPRLRWDVTDDV